MDKRAGYDVCFDRGSLVDQGAVRTALDYGRAPRASLDTVAPEPLSPGHGALPRHASLACPHIAWSFAVTTCRTYERFVGDLRRFHRSESLAPVTSTP